MEITDYLAFYGATLSTAVATWKIREALPKLRIELVNAIQSLDEKVEHGVGISIQNPSKHTVHIASVSLLYPYTTATLQDYIKRLWEFKRLPSNFCWVHSALSNYKINDGCPNSIEPGKSHYIFISNEILEEVFSDAVSSHLKVEVQDDLWRSTYSRKFEYKS